PLAAENAIALHIANWKIRIVHPKEFFLISFLTVCISQEVLSPTFERLSATITRGKRRSVYHSSSSTARRSRVVGCFGFPTDERRDSERETTSINVVSYFSRECQNPLFQHRHVFFILLEAFSFSRLLIVLILFSSVL